MTPPAILILGPGGLPVALALRRLWPEARVHAPARHPDLPADLAFASAAARLRALFRDGTPIVGVCAAGVLVRALAPLLADKRAEPPVLAVAEDGGCVVPLLGGHHGANDLARAVAAALGGTAAVTTAGDVRFGLALDDPPSGWTVANPAAAKPVTAALLGGGDAWLDGEAGWLTRGGAPFRAGDGRPGVRVTHHAEAGDDDLLVLHPKILTIGVGCERGASAEEVVGLVERALAECHLAPSAVALVASLDLKADEAAVHAAAAKLDAPARFFAADELERETPRLSAPSDVVFREVGCHGVAEAAALAAAGPDGRLLVPKIKSRRATCAVALRPGDEPIDPASVGRARGRLTVVGCGPGDRASRTREAEAALSRATDVVGYRLYLDLVADLIDGKALHGFELGDETARCRRALDLAALGRDTALVCSGDPGVYAMAALVFELLDEGAAAWRRVEVVVVPGVSAMQAAAARAGAPLGHDFCAISLSDLLTPWEVIERRLRAAAGGDFVVALYNPASRTRRVGLGRALAVLRAARPPETPVVLARNLGRPGETMETLTLDTLRPEAVDMLTLLIIGSRATRALPGSASVYTPRGYRP